MEHEYGLIGGNIFHGELTPDQLFHMRPAPGLRRLHDARRRALPVLVGDPRRRRRDRHPGPAVHPAHPRRRAAAPADPAVPAVATMTLRVADAPRRSIRPRWRRCSTRPARRACCRPPPTSTTPCWRGSARHLFAGGVGVRRPVGRPRRAGSPPGGRGRRRRRAARARRRRRAARASSTCASTAPTSWPRAGRRAEHRSIQCPYHGWRYGLDGALLSTPRFDDAGRVRPRRARPRAGRRRGVARLDHGQRRRATAPPVDEFLDGIEPHVADHEPERLVVGATHTYELATQLEADRRELPGVLPLPEHPPRAVRASARRRAARTTTATAGCWVGGWQDLMPHAVTMSLDGASADACRCAACTATPAGAVDYLGVLPNMLVSLHPDYVMTHRLEPIAPDRTAVECQWLFAPEAVAADGFDPRFAVDFWDLTNRQDWAACEAVQRGVVVARLPPGPVLDRRGRRRPVRPPRRRRLPRRRLDPVRRRRPWSSSVSVACDAPRSAKRRARTDAWLASVDELWQPRVRVARRAVCPSRVAAHVDPDARMR